ncbi:MAG: SOS response-associated peptidase, partial [Planctomycetota bacterium]
DEKIGYKLINARAETVAEKPSFREAYKKRRCLIVTSGFYEWKRVGTAKEPWRIVMKDRQRFAFAGLWERWKNPAAGIVESCTIITTAPNELMSSIHDRMPAILPPDCYEAWMDPETNVSDLAPMLRPFDDAQMQCYRISTLVNNPKNNNRECVEAVGN